MDGVLNHGTERAPRCVRNGLGKRLPLLRRLQDADHVLQRPRGTRLLHQLVVIVLTTASIAYFSMASDLGATPITAEFRGGETRQIWVSRNVAYADRRSSNASVL